MNIFEASCCNDAFVQISKALVHGCDYVVSPRSQETYELMNVMVTISNPYDRLVSHPERKLSLRYLVGEFLWYERASNLLEEISYYSKFWHKCSDDGTTINSSYGARIYGTEYDSRQWDSVYYELLRDPNSRRAMLTILRGHDLREEAKDVPCTVGLQFMIRDNKLHLTVWMRSNDLYLGFCYDAAIFTLWQEKMLCALRTKYKNLKMGTYTHVATSMHVYERNFPIIEKIANDVEIRDADSVFNVPKMNSLDEIQLVQDFERQLRTSGVNNVKLNNFDDPFADWLARCLYEG